MNDNVHSIEEERWKKPREYSSPIKTKVSQIRFRLSDVHSTSSADERFKPGGEFIDSGGCPRDKVPSLPVFKGRDKVNLGDFPKRHRSNSTDFAFSEANEASRIEMSTATTPKEIKEWLFPEKKEEKEDEVEIMRMMKNHL